MSKEYKKLIMVTPDNNNKYYEMIWDGGSNFEVRFGRIESGAQTATYPYSKWRSKYNEKINKGYKDVTDLVTVKVVEDSKEPTKLAKIADKLVEQFITLMKRYTDNLVTNTYSVKAEAVSQKQIDEAQDYINKLKKLTKAALNQEVNDLLVNLYTIIPRKMRSVKDYLAPNIKLERVLEQEQDNLDAMAAQVSIVGDKKKKKSSKKEVNLLDVMGISMKECKTNKDIQYLVDQIGGYRKIAGIFEVKKDREDKTFEEWMKRQKNRDTRILIHGTRCTSVIPILEQGLKIRPAGNFQFSGKVYGDGNYYSETVNKSLNYTGNDPDKVLLVYEVHVGKPFVYNGWYRGNSFTLNYKNLQERGFDSTFVKAGNGLLNSEIIAYNEQQNRIKYIIWIK